MKNLRQKLHHGTQERLVAMVALGLAVSFTAGMGLDNGVEPSEVTASQDHTNWKGVYTVTVERDGQVVYEDKESNILTTQGRNWIRSQISAGDGKGGDSDEAEYISVGNTSAPGNGDNVLPGEIQNSNLSRAKGSTTVYGTGEFEVQKEFTADLADGEQLVVNTTGLNYGSSPGSDTLISGGAFADANLLDGDKLTITHNVTINDS